MDADWRPMQGSDPAAAAGGDWRAQLQPEERSRIVGMMMQTLQRNIPVSVPETLNEFRKIAMRFEEKIYTAATDHTDYFRKISVKMLSMETKTQHASGNVQVISNQNNLSQASEDYTAQTGHAGAGDWQEEIYQMIKTLKDQHFVELNKLFSKVSVKLQHVDSIRPRQMPSGQYERMKSFKTMLNRILQVLQTSKSAIQPSLRNKVPQYEKQIISIFNSQRRKPVQPPQALAQRFQPPAGQASNSNTWQQQQPYQSLQNQSSMSTGLQSSSLVQTYSVRYYVPAPPTAHFGVPAQQNGANIQRQASFNMDAAQGRNFNPLQYGLMGGAFRQGSTGPMQGTMNAQLQTGSSSSMLSHLSEQRNHMTKPKRKWQDTL